MVTMKLRHPYTTASIWSSGKVTCTGANTGMFLIFRHYFLPTHALFAALLFYSPRLNKNRTNRWAIRGYIRTKDIQSPKSRIYLKMINVINKLSKNIDRTSYRESLNLKISRF